MLLEMHAHTSRHSRCSQISPETLIRQVVNKGLQGIIFTEHHYLWTEAEINELRAKAGIESHFLILSAQEIDTDIGHVLVFGAEQTVPEKAGVKELRALFPEAALVWAHPFRNGRIPKDSELLDPGLDGVEIFSLNHTASENYRALAAWHRCRFTALSGSDTHVEEKAGLFPTQFDHPVTTVIELAREIRRGRCRPFFKEIPKAGSTMVVTEITIGTKGVDEQRGRIIVKEISDPSKWEASKASARITDTLYKAGFRESAFRVPAIIDINENDKMIIEEGQRGKTLFDVLPSVSPETGRRYFIMAAQWLARLHASGIRAGSAVATRAKEERRFVSYDRSFASTGNPRLEDARRTIKAVKAREEAMFKKAHGSFVLLHGDYHPKNIIIGQDRGSDPSTVFASVIDFNNAMLFDPAFDAGYFLVQFRSQFNGYPMILENYPDTLFLDAYTAEARALPDNFNRDVVIFQARAILSVASHFISVGKGESPELHALVDQALKLI